MKRICNWVGVVAAIVLVLAVLMLVSATSIIEQRRSAFQPLNDEALRQIAQNPGELEQNMLANQNKPAVPVAPASSEVSSGHTNVSEQRSASPDRLSGLAKTITREALLREFRPGTNPVENAFRSLRDSGLKLKESLSWATGSDDNGNTALEIGTAAMNRGDIDEARDYLRAALDANIRSGDLSLRQTICGQLAWVEDDPEVAAALLETSCTAARPIDEEFLTFHVQNALTLSLLTGSDALAEHYYAQWDALAPGGKPIVNVHIERGGSEQIESWMEEHHPDFYETATQWDPTQKQEEVGTKRVG